MKTSKDMFQSGRYGGGLSSFSGVQILSIVLSVISLIAAVYIFIHFADITAGIAAAAVGLLTSGFPVLFVVIGIFLFFESMRWRMRRRFWW